MTVSIAAAVSRAVGLLPHCRKLPFLTDAEMERLFGAEVAALMRRLDQHNQDSAVCSDCHGRCCREMHCEIYAKEFGRCPIHVYRPVLCRMNFCHLFGQENREAATALISVATDTIASLPEGTVPARAFTLNALLYGECRDSSDECPEPILQMRRAVAAARNGLLSWDEAEQSLNTLVICYRQARHGPEEQDSL